MKLPRIAALIKREYLLEIRKKSTLSGIFLFTATVVYLIYKTFNTIKPFEWNILFWIILLFSGINAVAKSFMQEKNENKIHNYTLFDPLEVIISKLIYNFVFMTAIFAVIYLGFSFLLDNPIKDQSLFITGSLLGLWGISSIYTFVSAISSSTEGGALLMSILAIPLTLPIILLLTKISATSMRLIQDTAIGDDLLLVAGIDLVINGVILLLFKELWRD